MLIRPANIVDIPAMLALAYQSPTAAQWLKEHYEQAIQVSQPRRIVLVIEEKMIVAFLIARAVEHEWEIENIAVASDSRRRGFGSRILNEFLTLARQEKTEALFLEVRESNQAARSFYEKLAFEQTGRRPHYYTQPEEDAILYRHQLS